MQRGELLDDNGRASADEFPFRGVVAHIARHVRLLTALVLTGTLVGAGVGATRPAWYEATVTVLVRRTVHLGAGSDQPPSVADYPALLANRTGLAKLVGEFRLDEYGIGAEGLADLVRVRSERGTALLRITVTLPEPELAVSVANRFAERSVEFNNQLNASDVVATRDIVHAQLADATQRLTAAEAEVLAHRSDAQVELHVADTTAQLEERERLVTLYADLARERGRLLTLEAELAKQEVRAREPRDLAAEKDLAEQSSLFSSADDGKAESADDRKVASVEAADVPLLPTSVPTANPVRQLLDYQVAAARTTVAGLEYRLKELVTTRGLERNELPSLHQLYQGEIRLERLRLDRDVAAKAVSDLSAQYEQARLQVASRTADLQIVDRATVSPEPAGPGVLTYTLVGLFFGLVTAGMVLFVSVVLGRQNRLLS